VEVVNAIKNVVIKKSDRKKSDRIGAMMMSGKNSKFYFEYASKTDGTSLLELLEEKVLDTMIPLVCTRVPNAYLSYSFEGEKTILALCKESKTGEIAGLGVCIIKTLYVNGQREKVGYFEEVRLKKAYQENQFLIPQMYQFLYNACKEEDISYYITNKTGEKTPEEELLGRKRSYMPDFIYLDDYELFICKVGINFKTFPGYTFRQAQKEDAQELLAFYKKTGQAHDIYPYINKKVFKNQYPGLDIQDFYVLYKDEELVGCGAIWDQRSYKQYVVKHYDLWMGLLQIVSPIFNLVGLPKMPAVDEALAINKLAFIAMQDNDEKVFEIFLTHLQKVAPKCELLAIELSAKHPLFETAKKFKLLSQKGKLYSIDFEKQGVSDLQDKKVYIVN